MAGSSDASDHHATDHETLRSTAPGTLARTGERRRAPIDLEAEPSIQPQRARRVVGIDTEHRLGHTGTAQLAQRLGGDRPPDALATPGAADADGLEPAAVDAELGVLLAPDPVLDDPRDLVAIPGDDPQARVDVRAAVSRFEVRVAVVAPLPVVAEGLALGVVDGAVLI